MLKFEIVLVYTYILLSLCQQKQIDMETLKNIIEKHGQVNFYESDQTFTFKADYKDTYVELDLCSVTDYENWFPLVWVSDREITFTQEERFELIESIGKVLDDVINTLGETWNISERINTEITSTFN